MSIRASKCGTRLHNSSLQCSLDGQTAGRYPLPFGAVVSYLWRDATRAVGIDAKRLGARSHRLPGCADYRTGNQTRTPPFELQLRRVSAAPPGIRLSAAARLTERPDEASALSDV